jgi:hypothetical protein
MEHDLKASGGYTCPKIVNKWSILVQRMERPSPAKLLRDSFTGSRATERNHGK